MQADLVKRLRSCPDLPTPPAIALRVIDLAQDPFADTARTAEVIALDPALSARIMRVANSPLYANVSRRQVSTLPQAVTLLGLNTALSLALGFSLAATLRVDVELADERHRIWRRSVLAALASQVLGEQAGFEHPEELMLGGLLQDIGALALLQVFPDEWSRLATGRAEPALQLQRERDTFGADHSEVGAWLASHWNLPVALQSAIRHSEAPPQQDLAAACVASSGHFADLWLTPAGEPDRDDALQRILAHRDLSLQSVSDVIDAMTAALPEVELLFDVRLDCAHEADAIKRQACELMLLRNLAEIRDATLAREKARTAEARAATLAEQVRRDPLTGAYNRVQLEEVLQREFEESMRTGRPLTIAFIDLDDFKQVNDRHGHLVGDEVLRQFSQTLSGMLRSSDLLARYGGEEFLIVLGNCDAVTAGRTLERILSRVASTPMAVVEDEPVHITFSAGLACHDQSGQFASARDLLQAADEALYGAKRDGRNRITFPQTD